MQSEAGMEGEVVKIACCKIPTLSWKNNHKTMAILHLFPRKNSSKYLNFFADLNKVWRKRSRN